MKPPVFTRFSGMPVKREGTLASMRDEHRL